jgi:hypothetical protein
MSKRFIRMKENFRCENCGNEVIGDGFTNHCPWCLFGKHVDVNPGDRANPCGGLMEPVSVESKGSSYVIVHRCTKCGVETKNRSAQNDSSEAILAVAHAFARKAGK